MPGTDSKESSTVSSFRSKAIFMKSWRPENAPSNRDRLELYALHKQSVSGDAPNSISSNATVGERAKFQSWKGKRGMDQEQAMLAYIAECDRQVRVYGNGNLAANPQTPQTTPGGSGPEMASGVAPRGIAAIPLLCAAAAESRVAYLRRLTRTRLESAWWARQEALCGTPGTLASWPETLLLALASLVEYVSLCFVDSVPFPSTAVQSFFWPLHNMSLAVWMLLILVFTCLSAAGSLATTILWGSRRTGVSLQKIWSDELIPVNQSVNALCQPQQPISVRLVGLILLPLTPIIEGLCQGFVEPVGGQLAASLAYGLLVLCLTWWYWIIIAPWLGLILMCAAFWSGFCFAIIDLAGM